MANELKVQNEEIMSGMLSTSEIVAVAKQAEERIDAMKMIKNTAIKLTNGGDWVDQNGKPYLMVSGAEKIAAAFGISWDFLTPEPTCETDDDGHYTYTYHGRFTMAGRALSIDGSRSSRDGFFKEYAYPNNVKTEKPLHERTNRRDVKMSALTNLIGNGITRMIGIRNMTYADLEQFANIKKADIGKVEYKNKRQENQNQKANDLENDKQQTKPDETNPDEALIVVAHVKQKPGETKGKPWTRYAIMDILGVEYTTFSKSFAGIAKDSIEGNFECAVTFITNKFSGCDIVTLRKADAE